MSAALLTCALLLAGAPSDRILLDRIVASVNGDIVTLSELREAASPYLDQNATPDRRARLYQDVLEQLVNERLIAQQIEAANITVSDMEVSAAIEDILRQNNLNRDQLQQALEARGMDFRDYRADVKDQLVRLKLIDLKVRSRVIVREDDLRAEYERRMRSEEPAVKVEIAHIQLRIDPSADEAERQRVLNEAKALLAQLEAGAEFEELAKAYSQGPTASRGGGLGVLDLETLMPEFRKAVGSLDEGEVSPPVMAKGGVHLIRLNRRQVVPTKTFEALRDRIYQEMFRARVDEQMKLWLDELRREGAVETSLDGISD